MSLTENLPPEDQPGPEPSYEIVKELDRHVHDGHSAIRTLVKLSKPYIVRDLKNSKYFETDFVSVAIASLDKEDQHGGFHYEETSVFGCDESGEPEMALLYFSNRALTIWEAMYAIGEV